LNDWAIELEGFDFEDAIRYFDSSTSPLNTGVKNYYLLLLIIKIE
jgi:hypothetical protein